MAERRFDAGRLGKIERTPQGGVRVPAALTRTGVLPYRNADGSTRYELRPPDEVFRADSLASLRSAPVTRGHAAWITPDNWKQHALGHVVEGSERQDGDKLAAVLVVQESATIERLDSGEDREISMGYTCDFDATPGTYNGQRYDGVQRKIVYNHVALLGAGEGRAGRDVGVRLDSADLALACDESPAAPAAPIAGASPEGNRPMKIRFDGKEYDVTKPDEALALQHAADKVRTDATAAVSEKDKVQAKLDQAVADLGKARTDAADTKRFDAAVAARVELESAARTSLGADFDPKGKTDREIMVAVVRGDSKDFKDDGKSDDYVRSRFDAVIEKGAVAGSITRVIEGVRQDVKDKTTPAPKREDAIDPEASAQKMRERNANAWKGTPAN